jgi:ceramide glucosyltransferase
MRHAPAPSWRIGDDRACVSQTLRVSLVRQEVSEMYDVRHRGRRTIVAAGKEDGMTLATVVYLLVVLAPVSLLITLLAHAAVFIALAPRNGGETPAPPITVLKPVKGDEPGLYENLASLARQDYPAYEILVGAEDARDPALEVARQVRDDFPQIRIGIHAGARRLGLNPKVNLLAALFDRAHHDTVLISDSNVRVGPEYLRETAAEMADPAVGLVTNIVVGEGAGLGALLETLHLNSFVAAATSLARVAGGRACVIGKSMLLRRSDLERLGGLREVRNVLAEDFVIGRMYEVAGFRVALSPCLVRCVNEGWTVERFLNRHVRWAQMRRRIAPAAYFGELLLNPVLWISLATLSLWASGPARDLRLLAVAAAGIAVKCASDALVSRRLRGTLPRAAEVLVMPVKDLAMAAVWLVGCFRRRVSWRGNELRIERGSRLTPAGAQPIEAAQEAA